MQVDMCAKVICLFTHKGGVGKTFFTINLCDYLSKVQGKKVVLLDMDPQMNLTSWYLTNDQLEDHLVLLDNLIDESYQPNVEFKADSWASVCHNQKITGKLKIQECPVGGIHLLKGSFENSKFNNSLSMDLITNNVTYPRMIKDMIDELRPRCEYIIVDLNPSFNPINQCFLMYSDFIICPMSPDSFCKLTPKLIHHNLVEARSKSAFMHSEPIIIGFFMNMMKRVDGHYAKPQLDIKTAIEKQVAKITNIDQEFSFQFLGYVPDIQSVNSTLQESNLSLVSAGIITGAHKLSNGRYLSELKGVEYAFSEIRTLLDRIYARVLVD